MTESAVPPRALAEKDWGGVLARLAALLGPVGTPAPGPGAPAERVRSRGALALTVATQKKNSCYSSEQVQKPSLFWLLATLWLLIFGC